MALEYPIGNLPKKGTEIHLIRWLRTTDSWRNETVFVQYIDATDDVWVVGTSHGEQELSRDEWAIFSL